MKKSIYELNEYSLRLRISEIERELAAAKDELAARAPHDIEKLLWRGRLFNSWAEAGLAIKEAAKTDSRIDCEFELYQTRLVYAHVKDVS